MGTVVSVSKQDKHEFSKLVCDEIKLIEGHGVEGDAHYGVKVKHRSRVKRNPDQPNLRQVHLIHLELIKELQERGFDVHPGTMGENVTTSGIDILALPKDTILKIGDTEIQVTGLRNPCYQMDNYQDGLMKAVLDRDGDGELVRRAGVMGIVLKSGTIRVHDAIFINLPAEPHQAMEPV